MLYPLSYRRLLKFVERVKGIEPSQLAWKARALPLSYTRLLIQLVTLFCTACCRWTQSDIQIHGRGERI